MKDGVHVFHHPGSSRYVEPAYWCITLDDLAYFEAEVRALWNEGRIPDDPNNPNLFHEDPEVGPTIHQVNKYYIQPLTKERGGMSWALMRNPEGLKCDVFATHCWAEGVFEFISKVRRTWPRDAKHLWACFLANPQNGDLGFVLQGEINKSPFARALKHAKYLLVIPNRRMSIYTRLWCVYEAFLSLRYIEKRGLVIKLPSEAPPWKIAACLGPGLVLWVACGTVSFFMLGPLTSFLLAPLLWLFFCIWASLLVSWLAKSVSKQLRSGRSLFAREEIILGWLQLAVVGLGFGQVQYSVRQHRGDNGSGFGWDWEPGEGWACGYLTLSVVLMHLRGITLVISRAITKAEGIQLDFQTVRLASCTDKADEERIRKAISGHEDEIDTAIKALRIVGHFDRAVQTNLQYGMSAQRARDGLEPFRVITACAAWSYWWVTDLSAHYHHIFATQALIASCSVSLSIVYLVGDRAIFAIDAFLWTGMAFAVSSIIAARFLWESTPLIDLNMSSYTLRLQLMFFALMCLALVWDYGGFRQQSCQLCRAAEEVAEEDSDSDNNWEFDFASPLHPKPHESRYAVQGNESESEDHEELQLPEAEANDAPWPPSARGAAAWCSRTSSSTTTEVSARECLSAEDL